MERIAVYGAGTIGSCQATLIIGNGLPCTVIGVLRSCPSWFWESAAVP